MGRVKKKLSNELDEPLTLKVRVAGNQKDKIQNIGKAVAAFIAPELVDVGAPQDIAGFEHRPSWDVAVRFQDLKRLGHIPEKEKTRLKRRAIEGILDRAHQVLGSVIKPERKVIVDHQTFIANGQRGELDILETLEEGLGRGFTSRGVVPEEVLRFDARIDKVVDIALVMDASLSMTGEKIALLATSAAVVALCVPSARLSLMGFDSRAKWIKHFEEEFSVERVIEKVLELPTGGFTNLELALTETEKDLAKFRKDKANVILISDGKYTEGKDPTHLASRFKHLNVLKIGRDQAGRDLLLELTAKGNGQFFEVRRALDLPQTMYGAMKSLFR